MSRGFLALLLVSGLWAQNQANPFEKAPPDVDEALRGRIAKFFQAHVDGKFRQADEYVAEDTKDFYYEGTKPKYQSFKIDKIVYFDNFTKAKAIVICEMTLPHPMFAGKIMPAPIPSTWKLEKGQWFWYVDQMAPRETPWGSQTPGPKSAEAGPGLPASIPASIEELNSRVRSDKNEVHLSVKESSSDQVLVANSMPGTITLHLEGTVFAGLKVRLENKEVKPKEQAKVTFRFDPVGNSTAQTTEVRIVVDSIGLVIPIRVSVQ